MNLLERSTEGPHFTSATDLASIHHGQYSWFYTRLALAGLIIMLVSLHCHTAYLSLSKRGIKWVVLASTDVLPFTISHLTSSVSSPPLF